MIATEGTDFDIILVSGEPYVDHPLSAAGVIARALDALSDPLFGWLSDRTRTRFGRRRPYIAVGAPLCAVAFFALFTPPQSLSSNQAAVWFVITFVLYFVFHTVFALPHYALGPELTLDYHERSRLFGVREGFSILGTICAAVAPGVLMSGMGMPRNLPLLSSASTRSHKAARGSGAVT